ncbi:unnamed protein product [Closterium sp. Naga37s-1]|nr:unnamed protein product [Closterium sp. Naga37s-1]
MSAADARTAEGGKREGGGKGQEGTSTEGGSGGVQAGQEGIPVANALGAVATTNRPIRLDWVKPVTQKEKEEAGKQKVAAGVCDKTQNYGKLYGMGPIAWEPQPGKYVLMDCYRNQRESAVKCPTIANHLARAKKVQQQLARPGVLERFVSDEASLQAMRQCFAGLWSLEEEGGAAEGGGDDGAARNAIIAKAIQEPSEFVLKPQREGGGNNIYDEEITRKLTELTEAGEAGRQELAAFILMQRLFPPVHRSVLIRRCQHSWNDTLSELGVYGTYLRNGDRVVINAAAGHLLRTKTATSNEGGVASGFAVLDSPYLV